MQKRTYYIPTIEVIDMRGGFPLMAIATSKEYNPAPQRQEKAF
jgi:hypothetical protein